MWLKFPFLLLFILTTIHPPSFARQPWNTDHFITFFTNNMLEKTSPSPLPVTETTHKLSFPEAADLFNPNAGAPKTHPNRHVHGFSARGGSSIGWLPFLTSLQALEQGNLTLIEEELAGTLCTGTMRMPLKGKVQGIYVTSSNDKDSRLVAVRAVFGKGRAKDSLRFFGEHTPGLPESHIAVVGGTGRYHGANGFAVVKATGQEVHGGRREEKKLLFTVYIE